MKVLVMIATVLGVATACSSGSAPAPTPAVTGRCPLPAFGDGADYHPVIDAARFGPDITNPWYPLRPGAAYRYKGLDEGNPVTDVQVVTHRTRTLDGVRNRVVLDRLFQDGRVVERTDDYFAQDDCGNVWYFGEDTVAIENGKADTSGSWHAGVDGAQPGVFMPAEPKVGQHFRQEWYPGEAEDTFTVVDLDTSVHVPAGSYPHAIRTEETTALEPGVLDNKWYVKGVGDARELTVKGPQERLALVQVTK